MPSKYIIFEVVGDPRKDIAATAVISNLKKKFPEREIVVTSLNPEVYLHHPAVYRVYKLGNTPYFFEDYIKNKDSLVFRLDPFLGEDFIYRRKHLIEIWSELSGVSADSNKPELYFTAREIEATGKMIKKDRPLFLFETEASLNKQAFDIWKTEPQIESLNFSNIMAVVKAMQKEGYYPIHIKRPDEAILPEVEWLNLPLRQMICAVGLGGKNLFLNSFAAQAAAATGAAAAIISSDDDWKVWGYDNLTHINSSSAADIIQKLLP